MEARARVAIQKSVLTSGACVAYMSTGASSSLTALVAQVSAAKELVINYWDSKINEEDGSFEAIFGDPTQTPCTILTFHLFPFCAVIEYFLCRPSIGILFEMLESVELTDLF